MEQRKLIQTYFTKLGFEHEIADIYLALYRHGPQTMSSLSRLSGVERTRIYRLIDSLLDSGLIELESGYKRGVLRAAPIANLNVLISKREQELQNLQDDLHLLEQVLTPNSLDTPATRVQVYKGADGVKQMFWNQTKASTEVICILKENMQSKTDLRFFERWVNAMNSAGIAARGIVGDAFRKSQQDWYQQHSNEKLRLWDERYVSDEKFLITHSIITYNDVVGHYNWHDGEIFGIEIYNSDIAQMQRQVFELLWTQGV